MDEVLADTLWESMITHLDTIERVLAVGDRDSRVTVAEQEVPHLVSTVRALLDEHQLDHRGRCATCSPSRWRVRRRRCPVWFTVHDRLIGRHTPDTGRHARETVTSP